MQDNAIIIKLEDGDITTAQDDPDIEGIIHIPSIEYDHCVQEVQVPGQSFFNGLYLNVQDLEISGSGLPIVIDGVRLSNYSSSYANTWDFTTLTQSTQFTISNQTLIVVYEFNDSYEIDCYTVVGTTKQKTINNNVTTRCYLFNDSNSSSNIEFFTNNPIRTVVLSMKDQVYSDNIETQLVVKKQFIEFNWLTN